MGRPRSDLQLLLETLGATQVYFQPPGNLTMMYPCIRYEIDDVLTRYADNLPHTSDTRYTVTVIDRNPDSEIPKKIARLPLSSFNRFYTAANLNHFVYNLYF